MKHRNTLRLLLPTLMLALAACQPDDGLVASGAPQSTGDEAPATEVVEVVAANSTPVNVDIKTPTPPVVTATLPPTVIPSATSAAATAIFLEGPTRLPTQRPTNTPAPPTQPPTATMPPTSTVAAGQPTSTPPPTFTPPPTVNATDSPPGGSPQPPVAVIKLGTSPAATSANYLSNAGFEGNFVFNSDLVNQPDSWTVEYARYNHPFISEQDDPWHEPETVIFRQNQAPPWEADLFFIEGVTVFKTFGPWRPNWTRISQPVNLTPGERVRLTAHVFPDLVSGLDIGGHKIWADDPLAGEIRLFATTATLEDDGYPWGEVPEDPDEPHFLDAVPNVFADTGFYNGVQMPFGDWSTVTLEFNVPASGSFTVAVEVRGRWGLKSNGFIIDDVRLERINP